MKAGGGASYYPYLILEGAGVYEIICVGGGGGTVIGQGLEREKNYYDWGKIKHITCTAAGGGSGAYAYGKFKINGINQTVSISVGAKGPDLFDSCSYDETHYIRAQNGGVSEVVLDGITLVSAGGGVGGYTDNRGGSGGNRNVYANPVAGTGGVASVDSSAIESVTTNGENGTASHSSGDDRGCSVNGGASVAPSNLNNSFGVQLGRASSGSCNAAYNSYSFTKIGAEGYVKINYTGFPTNLMAIYIKY